MKKELDVWQVFSVFIVMLTVCIFMIPEQQAFALETAEYDVPVVSYEMDKSDAYEFDGLEPVDEMDFGASTLGTFKIQGSFNDVTSYNDFNAYGVAGGTVVFSYAYDGTMLDDEANNRILEDGSNKILGMKLTADIDKGVVIVQKSSDGETWSDIDYEAVNFFESFPNGVIGFYTPSGEDLNAGCYYRVVVAYRTMIQPDRITSREAKKHMEVYEFYLCTNSGTFSLHDLTVEESDLPVSEDYSVEAIAAGETMLDGATTTTGFSVDTFGADYTILVNGETAEDGASFTDDGKYTVVAKTKLGKTTTRYVYVFTGGEDQGISTYFPNAMIVQGTCVFRDSEYPCYAAGAYVQINATSENTPMLSGKMVNQDTGETIILPDNNRTGYKQVLSAGRWEIDFYSGGRDSGSVYYYSYVFDVVAEDESPYINFNNLMTADRICDYRAKHYEVVYQTTRGGYISVCFSDYDEAFAYAYEIEKRYVEVTEDGTYYKSENNPNVKTRYDTNTDAEKIALTRLLNSYARQNVEVVYFNPLEEFTYRTFNENDDLLECLENVSIADSTKVFPTVEEQDSLLARVPYINDFTFIEAANYDTVSVVLNDKNTDTIYTMEYDEPVDDQLSVTSEYSVIETNVYGATTTYDVVYMNENMTVADWTAMTDSVEKEIVVSDETCENGVMNITADSLVLTGISNDWDDNAIVNISSDAYSFDINCLVTEFTDFGLYKQGVYQITFVDRVGNSLQMNVTITGNASYSDVISDSVRCYTDFYNTIYLNDRQLSEEVM